MKCPITLEPFVDPVMAEDGHTYERAAIMRALVLRHASPCTGARIGVLLRANHAMRNVVDEWTSDLELKRV